MKIIKNIVPKLTRIGFLAFALLTHSGMANSTARDEVVFFLPDALGSAITAVDESGGLCWEETYTPFGDKSVGGDSIPGIGCGLLGEERGFTGHTEDYESDLVYAQQRYYDPSIGRFLSIDPIDINPMDTKTINRYAYAWNSPYRYTDPTGEHGADYTAENYDTYVTSGVSNDIEQGIRDGFSDFADGFNEGDSYRNNFRADSQALNGIPKEALTELALTVVPAGLVLRSIRYFKNIGKWGKLDGYRIPNCDLCAPPKQRGRPPTGNDGHPVELHHRNQTPNGPLDEMTRTDHRLGDNFKKNHPNTGQSTSQINRNSFATERRNYWNEEWDSGRFNDF